MAIVVFIEPIMPAPTEKDTAKCGVVGCPNEVHGRACTLRRVSVIFLASFPFACSHSRNLTQDVVTPFLDK